MKIGIIGPAMAGKSTLFKLLTARSASPGSKGNIPQAEARIPDTRVDRLAQVFRPRKITYATIEFADFPPLGAGCEVSSEAAVRLKACDALAMVVRAHRNPTVPWPDAPVGPDISFFNFLHEMILNDLCQVETLLARNKDKKRTEEEKRVLENCRMLLDETKPVTAGTWTEADRQVLRNFAFLSARPVLVAVNLDEEQLLKGDYNGRARLLDGCRDLNYQVLEFCGTLEQEISMMAKDEQALFLAEYGLQESGIARLAAAAYGILDLCSFFTVGEDEVRAWTVKSGTPVRKAAGKIHSDLERGFIRAEVIGYEEFMELGGSLKTAREQGKLRLEGKDYPVRDGDIINIRFNV